MNENLTKVSENARSAHYANMMNLARRDEISAKAQAHLASEQCLAMNFAEAQRHIRAAMKYMRQAEDARARAI